MAKRKSKKQDVDLTDADYEARMKALDATLTDINKRFGDGAILRLGDAEQLNVATIPTGSLTVDIALGVGGIPRGRITEIYGPESSGKTTMCLSVVAEAQKRGGLCAFVDMEHALDPSYAERIGVDLDRLYISQPDTGEQALEITEQLVRSGALDIVVVDSVAALVPRAEIEGEMGDAHVGLQARLMSQALRKLSGAIKQSNCTVMFTNQLREKVGVMFGCFTGDARVAVVDETDSVHHVPIRDIVQEKRKYDVLSYNVETNTFEKKPIVTWFNNGKTEQFLRFQVGERSFTCTPNHLLMTAEGEFVPAEAVAVGEALKIAQVRELAHAGGRSEAPVYVGGGETVTSIETISEENDRFDIEVEGNHCYVVDGVVVHNSPETTSGGRALKFYASVRLDIRRIQAIKQGGDNIGNRTRIRVTKNKVAAPFREAEFDIMFYQNGISKTGEIIDLGTDLGIIEKRGAFYRYNDDLLGQGRENSKDFLVENPEIADEIENKIREHYELTPTSALEEELTLEDSDE